MWIPRIRLEIIPTTPYSMAQHVIRAGISRVAKYLRGAKYLRAMSKMSVSPILKLSNERFINPYIFFI